MFDHSDKEEKENIAIRFTNEWDFKVTDGLNDDNSNYAKNVIKKYLECKDIKDEIKDKIKNKCIL